MKSYTINMIVFGQLADFIGTAALSLPQVADTDALQKLLHEQFPPLAGINFVIAVDKKITSGNIPLNASSVIALLPPFSGG